MGFKVPSYTPNVGSRPLTTPDAPIDAPNYGQGVAAGLQRGAGSVMSAADVLDRSQQQHAQERRRFDAVAANGVITKWEKRATSKLYGDHEAGTKGVLESTGEGAFEAAYGPKGVDGAPSDAKSVYEQLELDREELAKELASDEQRQLFDEHVAQAMLGVQKQVESHVSRQAEVAAKSSAEARAQIELEKVANSWADPELREQFIANGADAKKALAVSHDEGEALALDYRKRAAQVVLNQYLAHGDVKGAENYFATVKETLGTNANQYEAAITRERQKVEADTLAQGVVNSARRPSGYVDEGKALQLWHALPKEKRTDAAEDAFRVWRAEESQRLKADASLVYDRALGAYLGRYTLKDVSPRDEQWLRENDNEGWLQLLNIARRDADRWEAKRAGRDGGKKSLAEANAFGELMIDMARNPKAYVKMEVPEFSHDWSGKLDFGDYQKALAALSRVKEEQRGNGNKPVLPLLGQVRDAYRSKFGLKEDEATWSDDQRRMYGALADYVDSKARGQKEPPKSTEVQGWIDEKLAEGTVLDTGTFSDETTTRMQFELDEKYRGKKFQTEAERKADAALDADLLDIGNLTDDGLTALKRTVTARGQAVSNETMGEYVKAVVRALKKNGALTGDLTADREVLSQFIAEHAPQEAPKPPPWK